jgi:hypothetical protein
MVEQTAVNLALKYLDECSLKGKQASLVGMLEYVDYYERVVLVLDEVNEVLTQRPSLCFDSVDGQILFKTGLGRHEMTSEELMRGVQAYHGDFWARYKELTGNEPPDLKKPGSDSTQ